MTEELKQAAQQATKQAPVLSDGEVRHYATCCVTTEDAIRAAEQKVLERARTQRPAAQAVEREAFEAWWADSGFEKFKDTAFAAWQARASLPTQPAAQATPEPTTPQPLGYIPTDAIDQIKTPPRLITHKVPVLSYAAEGYTAIYTRPAPGVPEIVMAGDKVFAGIFENEVREIEFGAVVRFETFSALSGWMKAAQIAAAQAKGADK